MPGRDFNDHTELRPFGETTHAPDHKRETDRMDRRRGPRRSRSSADDGTITGCDLIADLDDEPAQQLVNQ